MLFLASASDLHHLKTAYYMAFNSNWKKNTMDEELRTENCGVDY
jgi:hypothetical protein